MTPSGAAPDAGRPEPRLRLCSDVPRWAHGLPLATYLARRFPYQDEAGWRRAIAAGLVQHRGAPAQPDAPVHARDSVSYLRPHGEPYADLQVVLLHRDDDLAVAVKPAHLPSHADGPFIEHTFVHQLGLLLGIDRGLHLVHRLDRETSGVLVAALNPAAGKALQEQFRTGTVRKVYCAVVRGVVEHDFTIDAAIGLHPHSEVRVRRAVHAGGLPAVTDLRVLARGPARTLVEAVPRTGRTHQIRVHLEHAGHPVVGDKLYGHPDAHYLEFVARMKAGGDPREVAAGEADRHLLHAAELSFVHPRDGSPCRFAAPMPAEFERALQ